MKQLLITDRFLPHKGGSRIYYYEVCRHLNIPVLTGPEEGDRAFDAQQNFPIIRRTGIRPDYCGRIRPTNPFFNLMINYLPPLCCMLFWCVLQRYQTKPEVIHAGGVQFAGSVALLIKKIWKTPFVVYAHGEELLSAQNRRFFNRYFKWVFRNADCVIANSEYTKRLLLAMGVSHSKIRIVIPGIRQSFFAPPQCQTVAQKYGLDNKRVVLSVGRLTERKGHKLVLENLRKVFTKVPNVCYVIVGTGEEELRLKQQVLDLGLDSMVRFTGAIEDDELHQLYHLCEIFILANRLLRYDVEGFGMVFLEANAACKPVIGGKTGGTVDAVQHGITGYLIDPEYDSEISKTLLHLLNDPETAQKMGQAGKQWAHLFLWPKQVEKIEALVHQLVKS